MRRPKRIPKRQRNGHARGGSTMKLYGAYVFRDKDPAINQLRTLVEDHYGHRVKNADLADISAQGGPSTACMHAWFFGKTMRPTNPTLEAAGRAMGYERVWRRMRENK